MFYIYLLIMILCSSVVSADAGLFTKTNTNAALHMPWDGKGISWEFVQKSWGMWNVFAVKTEGQYISGTSGTDWEYVYYAKPETGSELAWMSGNHGNEVLESIEFLVDGKPADYGNHKVENDLVIIETSSLIYEENRSIAGSVVRRYKIDLEKPNRLDFSYQTTFQENMLVDRAFACMLPVLKKHGRHIEMNGFKASFRDNFRSDGRQGFQKVTEALLYGDSGFGMVAGIGALSMVDYFRLTDGGAYVWDLSVTEAKLYFPRMIRQGLISIPSGTVWEGENYYCVVKVER